ncbi:MAG: NAD(P)-dependent alcohol dehydrogenase [Alphaproteobacteria bacterium]|nr:NAD(P)-dependent alcohol dehydrogenase [Alphaproteobacteria bacterium]MCB9793594.1 NAD(P)-dependent alcohol dehydrogenase [Alphaproteobacteria bacterium]
MQAITQKLYGTPDVLTLAQVEAPEVGEDEVLVRVHASAVTQGDRRLRSGDFPGITWLPGRLMMGLTGPRAGTPGTMFSGVVVAKGAAVTRFEVGDAVFGSADNGAWAELLRMKADGPLAARPAGLDHAEAAALPYGGLTSMVFLQEMGALQAGQRVCILGASGGVGRHAVQLAKHLGAHVTAVCSARNHARVLELGADAVVDYHSQDYRDAEAPFDLIFDTVGASRFDLARQALTPEGRYLSLMVTLDLIAAQISSSLSGGQLALLGVAVPDAQRMDALRELIEAGALKPQIGRRFSLPHISQAHAWLESGEAQKDVIVDVAA